MNHRILRSSDNLEFIEIAVLNTVGLWDYDVVHNTQYFYKILPKNTDYFDCSISEVCTATCSEQGHIFETPISLEPVTIDGEIGDDEWDDALELFISNSVLLPVSMIITSLFLEPVGPNSW